MLKSLRAAAGLRELDRSRTSPTSPAPSVLDRPLGTGADVSEGAEDRDTAAGSESVYRRRRAGAKIQDRFERMLALSRLLVLIPVVFLLIDAAGSFVYGADILIRTADGDIGEPSRIGGRLGVFLIVMDTFLVGATLMIAAFGFYELFVLRRERAGHKYWLPSWLRMRDLEDLKARVVSMLILVAAITFVDVTVESHDKRGVLFLGLGISVIIVALTAFLRFGRKDQTSATASAASALPVPANEPTPDPVLLDPPPRDRRRRIVALLSGTVRSGHWQLTPDSDVIAVAGFARLDLREAILPSPPDQQDEPGGPGNEVRIRLIAALGQVTVLIPSQMRIIDSGLTLLGSRSLDDNGAEATGPDAPLLVTSGLSILGRVRIKRQPPTKPPTAPPTT
jgi:uncharacterized membrane protein YqhA